MVVVVLVSVAYEQAILVSIIVTFLFCCHKQNTMAKAT